MGDHCRCQLMSLFLFLSALSLLFSLRDPDYHLSLSLSLLCMYYISKNEGKYAYEDFEGGKEELIIIRETKDWASYRKIKNGNIKCGSR